MDFDAISELAGQLVELVMSGDGMPHRPGFVCVVPGGVGARSRFVLARQ